MREDINMNICKYIIHKIKLKYLVNDLRKSKLRNRLMLVTYVITVHHVIECFGAGFIDVIEEGRDEP